MCLSQHCVLECIYVCMIVCYVVSLILWVAKLDMSWILLFRDMFGLKAQLCSQFWLLCSSFPGADFCLSFPPWFLIPFCSCVSHHVAGDWRAEVIKPTDPWALGWLQQHLLPLYFLFPSTSDLALLPICHLAATLHSTPSPRGQGQGLMTNGSCLGWQTHFQEAMAETQGLVPPGVQAGCALPASHAWGCRK